jgi:N-acetylmuramoyl-L-alanine amidase
MNELFKAKTPHYGHRRATMLLIHGTEVDDATSRAIFLAQVENKQGSCHYYIDDKGNVEQYLDESIRAWHAGSGYWAGNTDINSMSIGIELLAISRSRRFDGSETVFTEPQMKSLSELAKQIIERNKIPQYHVLGHQDVSCTRELEPMTGDTLQQVLTQQNTALEKKYDPGTNFDWKYLAENGIGLWHGMAPAKEDVVVEDENFKMKLGLYGYDIRNHRGRDEMPSVIRAFQTHFMPWNICGKVTRQSVEIIDKLLEKKYEQV